MYTHTDLLLNLCRYNDANFQDVSNLLFLFRYLRLKEGTRRKSLELYLPHPLLIPITRWDSNSLNRSFRLGGPGKYCSSNLIWHTYLHIFRTAIFLTNIAAENISKCVSSSIIFQSCDLWSLGVIIYVMLCGYPPFYSKHHSRTIPKDMRKKIMTGSFDFPEDEWSQISEMAKDIVRKWVFFLLWSGYLLLWLQHLSGLFC